MAHPLCRRRRPLSSPASTRTRRSVEDRRLLRRNVVVRVPSRRPDLLQHRSPALAAARQRARSSCPPAERARPGQQRRVRPTLRHRDGTFFLVTTDVTDTTAGHLLVTSADPRHGWSDPCRSRSVRASTPTCRGDEHGTCHLTWSAPGRAGAAIWQCQVDETTGSVLTQPTEIWAGTGGRLHGGAAPVRDRRQVVPRCGGRRHREGSLRSRRPSPGPGGPFEADPANPLLSHRSTNHPRSKRGSRGPGADRRRHVGDGPPRGPPTGWDSGFHVNGRETS
jgi:hypothetical protein